MQVLPMGFRPSAAIGQCATWAITDCAEAANRLHQVQWGRDYLIITYIDNILVIAHTEQTATNVAKVVAQRADMAAMRLNEIHPPLLRDTVPPATTRVEFLGKTYDLRNKTMELSRKTLAKLDVIDGTLLQPAARMTKRQMAATIGLSLFASSCCSVQNTLHEYYTTLRWYRDEVSGGNFNWGDLTQPLTPLQSQNIRKWLEALKQNTPAPLTRPAEKPCTDILFVDASVERWPAVWVAGGVIRVHAEAWTEEDHRQWNLHNSVASEPLAIRKALCRLIHPTADTCIHIYTDHEPIIDALGSPCAKGYSHWQLQRFIATFPAQTQFTHIPGLMNPADKFTRGQLGPILTCDPDILDHALTKHETKTRGNGVTNNVGQLPPFLEWREWSNTVKRPYRALAPTSAQRG